MTNYRRSRAKGATFFFTVALANRSSALLTREIDALRLAYAKTLAERPFICDAFVVLPDHLHAVWTLPDGDADFSTRWRLIKARFTRVVWAKMGAEHLSYSGSSSTRKKRERGIWQRRFWEHRIRDDQDYSRHVEYCWGNPVKHGLVARAADWKHSSIHRDIKAGRVPPEWTVSCAEGAFGE
ncbi:MAG: transposase [Silicimonas sp.]|nr:transposase [Silicimonas sp.]